MFRVTDQQHNYSSHAESFPILSSSVWAPLRQFPPLPQDSIMRDFLSLGLSWSPLAKSLNVGASRASWVKYIVQILFQSMFALGTEHAPLQNTLGESPGF